MSEAKATPIPWKRDCNPRHIIGNGRDICRVFGSFEDPEADANARMIVQAVNAHAELLEVCKDVLDDCETMYSRDTRTMHTVQLFATADKLRAAIAKTGEVQGE